MKILNLIVEEIKVGDVNKEYYVYLLHKPDGQVFYVGKATNNTKDERVKYHEQEARAGNKWQSKRHENRLKIRTIKKIWKQGGVVLYSIDSWHDTEELAYTRESELIAKIGRRVDGNGPLTNLTHGSEKQAGAVTDEAKAKISESLKKYYADHPEAVEEMAERGRQQFADPQRVEQARQDSLRLETGKRLMEWRRADPENEGKRAEAHGRAMKQWYKDNPEKTKEIIEKRNEKKRTTESRAKVSDSVKQKIKDNPEWDKARRAKTHAISREKVNAKQEFLMLLWNYLIDIGKLEFRKVTKISNGQLRDWRNTGKIPDWIEVPKGHGTVEQWRKLKEALKTQEFKNG
jgi:hypothetical protein